MLGKLVVLVILLSAITWVPGLLLVALQTSLAGGGWLGATLGASCRRSFSARWIWILAAVALRARGLGLGPVAAGRDRRRSSASSSSGSAFGERDHRDRSAPVGQAPRLRRRRCRRSGSSVRRRPAFLGRPIPRRDAAGRRAAGAARRVLRRRRSAPAPQDPRLRGGVVTRRRRRGADRLRGRLEVLRRGPRRQPGRPHDRARDHQPGRPERLGQDDADEPDRPACCGRPRHGSRCSGSRPTDPEELFRDRRLLHAVRQLPARHDRLRLRRTSTCASTASTPAEARERWPGARSSAST